MRRWEVAHVPVACDAHARMHASSFASSGAHEGPVSAFTREKWSVRCSSYSRWSVADDADIVECLTFTAKMPQSRITEGYNRLRDPTGKEVKLCYVTVRPSLLMIVHKLA